MMNSRCVAAGVRETNDINRFDVHATQSAVRFARAAGFFGLGDRMTAISLPRSHEAATERIDLSAPTA
jgi:hypothetical protein